MAICTCIDDGKRTPHTDEEKRLNSCGKCDENIREWTPEELAAKHARRQADYAYSQAFPGFGLTGMNMRAYFAGQALQALVARDYTYEAAARQAVAHADALLAELSK